MAKKIVVLMEKLRKEFFPLKNSQPSPQAIYGVLNVPMIQQPEAYIGNAKQLFNVNVSVVEDKNNLLKTIVDGCLCQIGWCGL